MQVSSTSQVKSDINVTPLVDVVLVLLIIFMVVTPMLQKGPAVKLPLTEEPDKKPENIKEVLVVIDEFGGFWCDDQDMTEEEFPTRMLEVFQRKPEGAVVIKADSRLTYGVVKRAMLAVKDAGFNSVALIADPAQRVGGS